MNYQSTRSDERVPATQAVLRGIAPDGGLYLNPDLEGLGFPWQECLKKDTLGMQEMLLSALLPGYSDMGGLVRKAYAGKFETEDLTPTVQVGDNYVVELFRGPTAAFKDVALSMLPQLITAAKRESGDDTRTVILTATSGDTGKAALEGFHDVEGTEIIVFFPDGGVSPVQKAQMVTQEGCNVHVCAVRGNFDDCQTAVKKTFAELNAPEGPRAGFLEHCGVKLSSANSINIGRLAPQLCYYFAAYKHLLDCGRIKLGDRVNYTVPTGNFGDILAGFFAKLLGLPVGRLICASNDNRVLTDFLATGLYDKRREFYRTTSPSMDILVSSNLERLLFLASGCDSARVAGWMKSLNTQGFYQVDEKTLAYIRESFDYACTTEAEVQETIRETWKKYGYLSDTHTAVGLHSAAAYRAEDGAPMVVLSTASPFKFPAAVLSAIGGDLSGDEFEQMERLSAISGLPVPKGLSGLKERKVLHEDVIDRDQITDYVAGILEK